MRRVGEHIPNIAKNIQLAQNIGHPTNGIKQKCTIHSIKSRNSYRHRYIARTYIQPATASRIRFICDVLTAI